MPATIPDVKVTVMLTGAVGNAIKAHLAQDTVPVDEKDPHGLRKPRVSIEEFIRAGVFGYLQGFAPQNPAEIEELQKQAQEIQRQIHEKRMSGISVEVSHDPAQTT